MRILHLTSTKIYFGGEQVHLHIAKAMQARGHEVIYAGLEGPIRNVVESAGIPFYCLPKFSPWSVRQCLNDIQPDVVHAMDLRASTYTALSSYPLIAHLHSNPPPIKKFGMVSLCMLFFSLRAKSIITVSKSVWDEFCLKKLFSRSFYERKVVLLPNRVDIDAIHSNSQKALPEDAPTPFDLVFVGRLAPEKRPELFVDCVARVREKIPNVRAVILGDGELRESTKARIAKHNLQDSVYMLGHQENPFPWIRAAKIHVMPSAWEGFGLVAIEAFALGKPVVACAVGGLKDNIKESCGCLCQGSEELAAAVCHYLEDETAYENASKAAVLEAQKHAYTQEYFDTVEALYQ